MQGWNVGKGVPRSRPACAKHRCEQLSHFLVHDLRCAPASPHGSDPSHHLSLWPLVAVGLEVLKDASWTTGPSSLPSHVPMFPGDEHMDEPQVGHSGAGPC